MSTGAIRYNCGRSAANEPGPLMRLRLAVVATLAVIGILTLPARADDTVMVGGATAVLIKPNGAAKGSLILMAGGDGRLNIRPGGVINSLKNNQLVRTRHA